jgi:hypothetical protein
MGWNVMDRIESEAREALRWRSSLPPEVVQSLERIHQISSRVYDYCERHSSQLSDARQVRTFSNF